jgi:1-acyl-sn-glycerol-3-phosphate acyltransferase
MLSIIRFIVLFSTKCLSALFYRFDTHWLSAVKHEDWRRVRLIVFLNHTSLFEPLFLRLAPNHFLWLLSQRFYAPGADITLKRPITGKIIKTMLPGVIPISRKRDSSWERFLADVNQRKITAILPEGRMKRRNGLDKHGQPMTVRGGVAEILQRLDRGKILFIYSGGLHHIQAPGDKLPRLFQRIKANAEMLDIVAYKKQFSSSDEEFKQQVTDDMQQRLLSNTP